MTYQTTAELEAGMAAVLATPRDEGLVRLVVRRPGKGQRETLEAGRFDTELGLVGDDWVNRPGMNRDGPSPYAQVTVMNARVAELISGDPDPAAWAQCGDQLYVELDLSEANLPPGARIGIGELVLEVQAEPHTGWLQFREWWGWRPCASSAPSRPGPAHAWREHGHRGAGHRAAGRPRTQALAHNGR